MVLLETSGPSIGELENVATPWHEVPSRFMGQQQDFEGKSCTFSHEQDFWDEFCIF